MSAPIGQIYKPAKKWGVTDKEWDCWLLELLSRWSAYHYEYNSYVISKIKSDVLASLVPPEEVSKRRTERKAGRWVRKVGVDPDDKRPDYFRSLSTFGDLFFGSTHGYHRVFKPEKGRRFALSGSFIILWDCEMDMAEGTHPECTSVRSQFFYNSMAATYTLVEEAERRGDAISLLVCPQAIDKLVPKHNKPQYRKSPVIPVTFELSDGSGEQSTHDVFTMVPNLSGIYNPAVSPDGRLPHNWIENANDAIRRQADPTDGMLSKYYYWVNSYRHDEIKEAILNFVWHKHFMHSAPLFIIPVLQKITARMELDKRGVLVYITALKNLCWFLPAHHYFKEMHKRFDCYIIDVGNEDWTMLFKCEPILLDNKVPIFNYININSLFKISLSQSGLIGFRELEIRVRKGEAIYIDFNGVSREFKFVDYPTAAHIERGIKRTFPTLEVERLTMPTYKMEQADNISRGFRVPDGVITITGYDVPNITYKVMKVIGGMIDGVAVT